MTKEREKGEELFLMVTGLRRTHTSLCMHSLSPFAKQNQKFQSAVKVFG
jgi:hypothetical protein